MSRIQLNDNIMDVTVKMAGNNPGAIGAIMAIMAEHGSIDPQGLMGGFGAIMSLDTWEIYGTDIYILFNDKCNRDVRQMLMLIRAVQLGFFPTEKLKQMAADQARQVDLTKDEWSDLDKKVCDKLEGFKKP